MSQKTFILILGTIFICYSYEESSFQVSGDLQTDFQVYIKDINNDTTSIPEEKMGSNSYLNFVILKQPFSAGVRLENYQPVLVGYDPQFKGLQIAHRYAQYMTEKLNIVLGNFYEQYGSGIILCSHWDWSMGYDNAFDGVNIRVNPWQGIALKGLVGTQRLYNYSGPGIVRGLDGELSISDLFQLSSNIPSVTIGGSFVSKYQKANHPTLNLPANVAAGSGRATISYGIAVISAEYAYKINDPQQSNNYIYKEGNVALLTASVADQGIGLSFCLRRIDNMDFRSDRGATGTGCDLRINNIQPLVPQFTYSLTSMYPYIPHPNGEIAGQIDFFYKVPSSFIISMLREMKIWLNFSRAYEIIHNAVENSHIGYTSPFFKLNDTLLFQNLNMELRKKIAKKLDATLSIITTQRNDEVLKLSDDHEMIYAYIGVLDMEYKIGDGHTIKTDVEHLFTHQDKGNWLSGSLEYEFHHFFVKLLDDYNYGNPNVAQRNHYFSLGLGYTYNTTRVSLSYGRTRAGIMCSGGVCRVVPSISGLSFSLSATF
jgi:hypothetical protein